MTIGPQILASQIASLINYGGQLRYSLAVHHILRSRITYLVEMDRQKVIGTIGLELVRSDTTELKHLAVDPAYRGQGIGKRLLERGIASAETPFVYGLVRKTNKVNIRNNLRVGMTPIGKVHNRLIIFARRKDGCQNRVQRGSQEY